MCVLVTVYDLSAPITGRSATSRSSDQIACKTLSWLNEHEELDLIYINLVVCIECFWSSSVGSPLTVDLFTCVSII